MVHAYSDLHLTAQEAVTAGLITGVADFSPPKGKRVANI